MSGVQLEVREMRCTACGELVSFVAGPAQQTVDQAMRAIQAACEAHEAVCTAPKKDPERGAPSNG